ncbi:uncharacterized protein LOC135809606 [Sycon ciliatum]|uniref:uncharacterized protein LOC135809606 n=1 Tax=Sycon ciliatum TaxID=27933 RepID=UPI0031F703F0
MHKMGGGAKDAMHALLLLVLLASVSEGSHFRGGTISCGPDPTSNGGFDNSGNAKIQCSYRVAWRLNYHSGTECNETQRNNAVLLNGEGTDLVCHAGCSGSIAKLSYVCTEFSPPQEENWSQGGRTVQYTFPGAPSRFSARLATCCWIATLARYARASLNFVLPISMDLGRRSDTGMINHSPSSNQPAIRRLQHGCAQNLSIHTADADGDIVRCRWGTTSNRYGEDECGDICSPPEGITLTSEPCTLYVPPTLEAGKLHAVSIVFEDFAGNDPNGAPMSQVSLQFLLDVQSSTQACSSRPVLVAPSPEDKTCIPIAPNTEYRVKLRARQTLSSNIISGFSITQPVGMQRSSISNIQSNGVYYGEVELNWTPRVEQYGPHVFCFLATDNTGQTSEQQCVTLMAGASMPEIVPGTTQPSIATSATVPHYYASFSVDFNQQVFKSNRQAKIRILEVNGSRTTEVFSLVASSSKEVKVEQHPTHDSHYRLTFAIPERLKVGQRYAITLDSGVVVGTQSCIGGGVPSEGLTDTSVWQFVTDHTTGDISSRNVSLMLPYGKSENDNQLQLGDGLSCHSQPLATASNGYPLWGNQHSDVTICENGVIMLDQDQPIRHPQVFPGNWATQPTMLTPYWCLADNNHSKTLQDGLRSHVWYHFYERQVTSDKDMLEDIESLIMAKERQADPSFQFTATWGAVVTWERITPYPSLYQYQLHNTFQGVLASDGLRSYALYIYDPSSIQWSVPTTLDPYATFGHAVSGYSTPTRNHADSRSGTFRIADIDNRAVKASDPSLLQTGGVGAIYVHKLYDANTFSGPRQRCLTWHASQPEPTTWLQHLDPCPCTVKQARADSRFELIRNLLPRMCFQNSVPSINGSSQECCYRTQQPGQGAFIEGAPDGGNSVRFSWLSYEPTTVSSQETLPYQWCCKDEALCHLFREKRPSQSCDNYEPLNFGFAALPLAQAVNSGQFIVDAPGTFLLLQSASDGLRVEALSTQPRPGVVAGITSVGLTAEDADTVLVDVSPDGALVFSVNGMPLTNKVIRVYSDEDENITVECLQWGRNCHHLNHALVYNTTYPPIGISNHEGLTAVITNRTHGKVVFDNGITWDFSLIQPWNTITASVGVPQMSLTSIEGLLSSSTLPPTKKAVLVNATSSAAHINQWRLECSEIQLVTDPRCSAGNTSSGSPVIPTAQPVTLPPEEDDFWTMVNKTCGNDTLCRELANVTGDIELTKNITKKARDEKDKDDDSKKGRFPVRTANPALRCLQGICNIDLAVLSGIRRGTKFTSVLVDRHNSSFQVIYEDKGKNRYRLALKRNVPATNIQFVAIGNDGRVVLIRPVAFVCDCDNGMCTDDFLSPLSSPRTRIYGCECPQAYDGTYCELDRDGCKAAFQPCASGVMCMDEPAPNTGFQCGPCPTGFSGDGQTCFDLDECKDISPSPCAQECVNTQGSYQCACNSGFQLAADDVECDDIDECSLGIHGCNHLCTNSVGSYECECYDDYVLNGTTQCIPILSSPQCSSCEQGCRIDSFSGATCFCLDGYDSDFFSFGSCSDIDECSASPSPCLGGHGTCNNTEGSFNCVCDDGYSLALDRVTCQDVDECIGRDPVCSGDMLCTNTQGSYQCSCQTGHRFNQTLNSCQAISCGRPPVPAHGLLNSGGFTFGDTVVYFCDIGYSLRGAQTTECLASGQWSQAVPPRCEIVHCPSLVLSPRSQSSSTNTTFSSVWTFNCSDGYTLSGAETLTCLPNGRWDNSPPVCDKSCIVSDWTAWSACSVTCLTGQRTRTRQIIQPFGGFGTQCPDLQEIEVCRPRDDCGCGTSPIGSKKAEIKTPAGTPAADVLVIVDESDSMDNHHQWLADTIPQLDISLQDAGVGTDPALPNHYALVGYGRHRLPTGNSMRILPSAFADSTGSKVFTVKSFLDMVKRLSSGENIEDGYLAIQYALENLTDSNGDNMLRLDHPNVATSIILVTNEDRDVYASNLTRHLVKHLIRKSDAKLNVIVDQRLRAQGQNRNAMGVDAKKMAYFDEPFGAYLSTNKGFAGSEFYRNTKHDYTTLALEVGGAAWDINVLRRGGSATAAFSRAFVSVQAGEITDQVQICERCSCVDEGRTARWSCNMAMNQDLCKKDVSRAATAMCG